jgi:hypothetical protein
MIGSPRRHAYISSLSGRTHGTGSGEEHLRSRLRDKRADQRRDGNHYVGRPIGWLATISVGLWLPGLSVCRHAAHLDMQSTAWNRTLPRFHSHDAITYGLIRPNGEWRAWHWPIAGRPFSRIICTAEIDEGPVGWVALWRACYLQFRFFRPPSSWFDHLRPITCSRAVITNNAVADSQPSSVVLGCHLSMATLAEPL